MMVLNICSISNRNNISFEEGDGAEYLHRFKEDDGVDLLLYFKMETYYIWSSWWCYLSIEFQRETILPFKNIDVEYLLLFHTVLYCIEGVVIAAQCNATFLKSIVVPRI